MIQSPGKRIYLSSRIPPMALEWRNTRAINKWCRQYTEISDSEHQAWLKRLETDKSMRMFGIYITGHIEGIGVCGLTSINHVNQTAEFSLYIAPSQHGAGFGKEALETLLLHGFQSMNLNRIWGEVYEGNPAMEIFKSVGFQLEGILRESFFRDGKFIDSHIISILRREKCSS